VFATPAGIPVSATPCDPDGTIQRLDFYEIHIAPGYGWSVPIGTLTNSPWGLTWNSASTGAYPIGVRVIDNHGAETSLSNRIWAGVTRPINDDFAQRITIPNLQTNVTVYGSNHWSTGETWEPYGRSSVWWSWTAPASGPTTIDTCGSFDAAYLKLFTGTSISNLSYFGAAAGTPCASLPFSADAGTTYHIAVEGNWEQGHIQLNLSTPQSPSVWLGSAALAFNGGFHFSTPGVPGQQSVLEASTNLVHWAAISTNQFIGSLLQFEDSEAIKFRHRFYRVRQQ
jgi:hypothetical protein